MASQPPSLKLALVQVLVQSILQELVLVSLSASQQVLVSLQVKMRV
jgi:hypothetical protein